MGACAVPQEICLQTVAANFAVSPSLAYLPEAHLSKLISLLSLELPLELAGTVRSKVLPPLLSVRYLQLLHTGYRQRGVLEKASQQYMEQLPGEDHIEKSCILRWSLNSFAVSLNGAEAISMLLCRHQATVSPGSNYIFNAIWRRNWKSKACKQQSMAWTFCSMCVRGFCLRAFASVTSTCSCCAYEQHLTRLRALPLLSACQSWYQNTLDTLHAAIGCNQLIGHEYCFCLAAVQTCPAVCRFDPAVSDINELKRLLTFSTRFVNSLHLEQLPSHLDLQIIFEAMRRCV